MVRRGRAITAAQKEDAQEGRLAGRAVVRGAARDERNVPNLRALQVGSQRGFRVRGWPRGVDAQGHRGIVHDQQACTEVARHLGADG